MDLKPLIKIENLKVIYLLGKSNQVDALKNINLEIYPGEFVIFFGPSGCGKSTLLYATSGLEKNTLGNIFFDGKNLTKFSQGDLESFHQKKIGMIFQAYYLISSLSVLDNVILPQFSLNVGLKERETRALQLLDYFGVKLQAHKMPNELSGGQQQRVAICRALINEPEVIMADEPTGNLDSKSAQDVMGLLKELNEKRKKTVILVTHSPEHLSYAHRVFYMKDGQVIDIKVNRDIRQTVQKIQASGTQAKLSKDLELLARTYSNFSPGQLGFLLIPFKAKQIVSEVLTEMSAEQIESIEKQVVNMLKSRLTSGATLSGYLDRDENQGGLNMDKRSAKKLAKKIESVVSEVKLLQEQERQAAAGLMKDADLEVRQIRQYLFDVFDVDIKQEKVFLRVNKIIKERLNNKIDRKESQRLLDLDLPQGGAGLDRRLARKISRRLELLILGKYQ